MNEHVLIGGTVGCIISFIPVVATVGWLGLVAMVFTLFIVVFTAILSS